MEKIVLEILRKNKIKHIDKEELKIQISSHPSYPSLHAVTGVLDHFSIENVALNLPQTNEVYKQLPNAFIAQITIESIEHFVAISLNQNGITVKYADNKKEQLNKETFLESWTGIIVAIDKEELVTETNKLNATIAKYTPIVALVFMMLFFYVKNVSFEWFNALHLSLSLLGVLISYFLIKHELGIGSETIDKLCNSTERTSCDTVLNSNGASLFAWLKLSDVSFVYFTSLCLTWVLYSLSGETVFSSLSTLSLLAIPVVFYSIYYQAIVLKKWCPLCLGIGGLLLGQSLLSYLLSPLGFLVEWNSLFIALISFLSIIILYSTVKPILTKNLSLTQTKTDYYKFKRKFSLFNSLYENGAFVDSSLSSANEIVFGNKHGAVEIILITSPLCGFCKATHHAAEQLLRKDKDNELKLTVRFNIGAGENSPAYRIANALVHIYKENEGACKEAMHEIYTEGVNVEEWLTTYQDYIVNSPVETLDKSRKWCIDNGINFTPAIYLNNKLYPKEYDLEDLSLFMDDFVEEQQENSIQAELKTA